MPAGLLASNLQTARAAVLIQVEFQEAILRVRPCSWRVISRTLRIAAKLSDETKRLVEAAGRQGGILVGPHGPPCQLAGQPNLRGRKASTMQKRAWIMVASSARWD